MAWRILLRLTVSALLTGAVLPAAFSQSQDNQSVAEAARRAKEQKKASTKPARVITEDDVKPFIPAPASPATPSAPAPATGGANTAATAAPGAAQGQPASATAATTAQAPANAATQPAKDGEKQKGEPKEVADLKEQIKQALFELDLLQRQLRLDQDTVYSKTDYAGDKAGIAKVDAEKQQVSDKQQEIDALKAKLADLLQKLGIDASATPR